MSNKTFEQGWREYARQHPDLGERAARLAYVKTSEGRALYNAEERAKKGVDSDAAPAAARNFSESTLTTQVQAVFHVLVADHVKKHGCTEREARLAVMKTDEGRAIYNELARRGISL